MNFYLNVLAVYEGYLTMLRSNNCDARYRGVIVEKALVLRAIKIFIENYIKSLSPAYQKCFEAYLENKNNVVLTARSIGIPPVQLQSILSDTDRAIEKIVGTKTIKSIRYAKTAAGIRHRTTTSRRRMQEYIESIGL